VAEISTSEDDAGNSEKDHFYDRRVPTAIAALGVVVGSGWADQAAGVREL
jgi:hypothetical protein